MSELGPGLRVGQDAAGIIVDVRCNEPRSNDGEEQQQPGFRASQKLHAHSWQTSYGWNGFRLRRHRINAGSESDQRKSVSGSKKKQKSGREFSGSAWRTGL